MACLFPDVDGKVVHVAERPPPSQRLANSDSSGSNANPSTERRQRGRPGAGGMRNSPLFRALDGMVVGTMAFPVNPNVSNYTEFLNPPNFICFSGQLESFNYQTIFEKY